jgi:glycosyltransferase involved in cell wall biosynthesis
VKALLMLASSSVTGPAELMLQDAKALRDAGHTVHLACDTRRPGNLVEAIRAAGFPLLEELTLCQSPSAVELWRDVRALKGRLKDEGYDIVHCRFTHDHLITLAAAPRLTRVVRTVEISRALRPGRARSLTFRRSDGLIASCASYANVLEREHRAPRERVAVIPGSVDCARFSPGRNAALRKELGVPEGAPVAGIISRIKPERLHEPLVRAFREVKAAVPEARLLIIGRGEHEPELRGLVSSLGLDGTVIFAGYRAGEALPEAYRALDVAVWLAEGNDGTCRGVLEAMASGVPVVGGLQGAIAEAVVEGETGRRVELGDERSLARALIDLLADLPRAKLKGAAGRERAQTLYAPARRATALVELYQRILALPPVRG